MADIESISVSIYTQGKEFMRKALLAVNEMPPVNPDERQKARGLEVARTVPPRPVYFGHYQQLIYNQSNPTQPSSRNMVYEHQARLQCLQGTADIVFTGENRYLSEPALFPYEFLVVLRLVQLIRLREESVPSFIIDLEDLLGQLTGHRRPSIFTAARDDIELDRKEYPWRTGLAEIRKFSIARPLRRSLLQRFPRSTPVDVVRGLATILTDYAALNMWEAESNGQLRAVSGKSEAQLEKLGVQRDTYLALLFSHLCFFHPKIVTLEDSPDGLSLRLGISVDVLMEIQALFSLFSISNSRSALEVDASILPEGCKLLQRVPDGSIAVLQVTAKSANFAFVCLRDTWTLWANCIHDNAQVLTECSQVQKYFALDVAVSGVAAAREPSLP